MHEFITRQTKITEHRFTTNYTGSCYIFSFLEWHRNGSPWGVAVIGTEK